MEFFFKKVVDCNLTKKELHHSFFWMNFVKVYRSEIKYLSSFCSFTSALTQNSILKNLFKSYRKITVMFFLFDKIAGFEVTERKDFIIIFSGWIFCEIFRISFFLKQLRANLSVPSRPWSDFTSFLEDVTVFLQVNFDTCTCAALPQQQLFD